MKEFKTNLVEYNLVKKENPNVKRAKIKSSKDSSAYCKKLYGDDISFIESFIMITLNNANNTTGWVKISQGGMTGTLVDIKVVAKYAVESLAVGVIFCHNHPSGTLHPSTADKNITRRLKEAFKTLDIKVLDHIILPGDVNDYGLEYFSFADDGIL